MLLQLLQRLLAGLRLNYLVAGAAEIDDDKAADAGFVLQDQYFFIVRSFLTSGIVPGTQDEIEAAAQQVLIHAVIGAISKTSPA